MFERIISLITEDKLNLIKTKKILILGVGGVGGYAAESLVRSGIQDITIVDHDIVDISNLNRQIIALHSTIDKLKVEVLKERLIDINPNININAISKKVTIDNLNEFNLNNYDYILDCLDDIDIKIALARLSLKEQINLLTSTGTARKLHPELLTITTLDKTSYDPLAKKMRNLLKGEKIHKLKVFASTEPPIKTENNLGSLIFVPASAGLLLASYVINDIIKE